MSAVVKSIGSKGGTPEATTSLQISAPRLRTAEFHIVGTAPYCQHRFSQKALEKMKATQKAGQQAKGKKVRDARNFEADYEAAKHVSEEGWLGIPAPAIRTAMIEEVVERARDPESPLHEDFEWDDDKAAEQYRLVQARQLIRVAVQVDPSLEEPVKVRVFTSLKSDRKNPGGGYRSMQDVLSHDGMRQELLQQALTEFKYARDKYKEVKELADVFASVDAAVERHQPAAKPEQRASA